MQVQIANDKVVPHKVQADPVKSVLVYNEAGWYLPAPGLTNELRNKNILTFQFLIAQFYNNQVDYIECEKSTYTVWVL